MFNTIRGHMEFKSVHDDVPKSAGEYLAMVKTPEGKRLRKIVNYSKVAGWIQSEGYTVTHWCLLPKEPEEYVLTTDDAGRQVLKWCNGRKTYQVSVRGDELAFYELEGHSGAIVRLNRHDLKNIMVHLRWYANHGVLG